MKPVFVFLIIIIVKDLQGQSTWKIGGDIGRAYFHYQFKDYGQGAYNLTSANNGLTAEITLTKQLVGNKIFETGLRFVLYEQYYATRLYNLGNEQRNPVVFLPAYFGYHFRKEKFSFIPKGGILLGIMPDIYEAEFYSMFSPDLISNDSLSRGIIYRNFTPVFPMVSLELDASYQVAPGLEGVIKISGAKGFLKITEFDIYYNDGSGMNDQRARQWGYGDYAAISFGFRYQFKKKNKF